MSENWSDKFNRWRVFPRVFALMYCYLFVEVATWFMALPAPTGPQAAFVSTIVGAAAGFFAAYVSTGGNK